MSGVIRIIGGKWRGRKLPVLDKAGLRPTTDRLKETLFNWLMPVMLDSVCLDCFSGSGSLGFEALSRGANRVTFLEQDKAITVQLRENSQSLQATDCQIVNTNTVNWLNQPATTQFDIVFIDPPFHQQLVPMTIEYLEKNGWLKPTAYIYIETEQNSLQNNQIPTTWQLHREKIAGQVHSRLLIREIR